MPGSQIVMGWKDSGLQIISVLIGSTLVLTSLTGLYSILNQPHIYIGVQHTLLRAVSGSTDPVDYDPRDPPFQVYEIIARNDGRESAKDLRLSLFFYSNITDFKTVIFGEDVKSGEVLKDGIPSLLVVNTSRLSHDAVIVVRIWTPSEESVPYYISATYQQGSDNYMSEQFRGKPPQIAALPDIEAGNRGDVPQELTLMIILLILSAISFAVALGHKKIRLLTHRESIQGAPEINYAVSSSNKLDISFLIAAIILSSLLVFFLAEQLPLSILVPLDLLKPTDLTSEDQVYGFNLVLNSIIFSIFLFFIRGLIAYKIAGKLVKYEKIPEKTYGVRNLKMFSFLIMGWPIYSIIILFFNQLVGAQLVQFFLVVFVIEIVRMSLLVLIIPRINYTHLTSILNGMKYIAAACVAVAGLIHLSLASMLFNADFFLYSQSQSLLAVTIVLISIGLLQILWIFPTIYGKHRWQVVGIGINSFITIVWISSGIAISILLQFLPTQFLPIRPGITLQELPAIFPFHSAGIAIELLLISYIVFNFIRISAKGTMTYDFSVDKPRLQMEKLTEKQALKTHYKKNAAILAGLVVSVVILGIVAGHISWFYLSEGLVNSFKDAFPRQTLNPETAGMAVAINPETNLVYVANRENDTISVFNASDTRIADIGVGHYPIAVAINPETNLVYVANWGSDTVSIINASTNKALDPDINVGSSPNSLAIDPETNLVYVANWGSDTVSVINASTNKVLATGINVGKNPIAVAINPETNLVYVANWGSDTVSIINASTNKALDPDINVGSSPNSLAIDPENNNVYAAASDHLSIIDERNTVDNINYGGLLEDLTITPKAIFVVDTANMRILSIDRTTDRLVTEIAANFNPDIEDIAFNPNTGIMYLATGYDVSIAQCLDEFCQYSESKPSQMYGYVGLLASTGDLIK